MPAQVYNAIAESYGLNLIGPPHECLNQIAMHIGLLSCWFDMQLMNKLIHHSSATLPQLRNVTVYFVINMGKCKALFCSSPWKAMQTANLKFTRLVKGGK